MSSSTDSKYVFRSSLALMMEELVQEKRASGYRYHAGAGELQRIDRFLVDEAPTASSLSRSVARKWMAKRPGESAATQQRRITALRQLALFLRRRGHSAYVPEAHMAAKDRRSFKAHVFTNDEVRRLFREVDRLPPLAISPTRHLVMPEILRLLYGCGLRREEVLKLRVEDVDLNNGVLTIRDAKFGADRLVPPTVALVQRLRAYDDAIGPRPAEAYFFPSAHGGPFSGSTLYTLFRQLLLRCGIPHGGPGKGPRVHDLRHTFAVHALLRWYREGADLEAKIPVLSTYLGHTSLRGTQYYLHLTAELFPEVTVRVNAAFDDVIPREASS